MTRSQKIETLWSYFNALVLVTISISFDLVARAMFHQSLFFIPLTAITLSAVLSGTGPGIFSTFLATASLELFLMQPKITIPFRNAEPFFRLFMFFPAGVLISLIGGKLRSTLKILKDSIEQLNFEQRLREKIIAGITHDIRNPLTLMKMRAELARRNIKDSELCDKSFKNIIDTIDRADNLIRDLLDVSRAKAGNPLFLCFETFDLALYFREICDDYRIIYGSRMKFILPLQPIFGIWDRVAIRRILENLITNAVKYGLKDGPIEINILSKSDQVAEFSVHNLGEPIPLREQASLFDFFGRSVNIENTTQGWGIGLSVVKSLAEAHCGSVTVSSDQAGGTYFIVRLKSQTSHRKKTPQSIN